MTLGDLFSARLNLDSQQQIIEHRGKNKNFQDLETKLNNIFYPVNDSFNYEAAQNAILSKEADDLSDIILKNADAILGGKISTVENKKYINFQTLVNSAKKAEQTIEKLRLSFADGSEASSVILNKLQDLTAILQNCKNQIDQIGQRYPNKVFKIDVKNEFTNISKILNTTRAIGSLTSIGDYLQRRGLILEEIFSRRSSNSGVKAYDDFVDSITSALADEGITGKHTGQLAQRRGGSGLFYLASMQVEGTKNKKMSVTETASRISAGELGNINSTIRYDPGSARQIKADVDINFKAPGGMNQTFKASLKNWSSIENKHLGTTSILAAVDRTSGSRLFSNAYALSLASTNAFILNQAHRMARLSILMDVITGFSQSTGYTDTLIINTGSKIKVIDPRSLINDIYGKEFIRGYNEGSLTSTGQTILNKIGIRSPGRTKIYLGNMFTYLAATKVTVMMNRQLLI